MEGGRPVRSSTLGFFVDEEEAGREKEVNSEMG